MFFCLFRFTKVDVVNCHSLNCLFIGVILKIIRGVKLIYDTHELETERNGLTGIKKVFSKKLKSIVLDIVTIFLLWEIKLTDGIKIIIN